MPSNAAPASVAGFASACREPVKICLPSRAENPCDSVNEKRRGKRAEHEIFDSRFERERIPSGEANEHVERDRYQLERDKDENEVDCGNEVHQSGTGEKRQRHKLAETRL